MFKDIYVTFILYLVYYAVISTADVFDDLTFGSEPNGIILMEVYRICEVFIDERSYIVDRMLNHVFL
jgi:hypothetical protein